MNIYVSEAKFNGADLVAGDQIAVFDGSACVAAKTLAGSIVAGSPLAMIASTDDPTTPSVADGFVNGRTISFKYWKASSSTEVNSIVPAYSVGGPGFASLGTALVKLSATNVSAVESGNPDLPTSPLLLDAYPNPCNPATTILFTIGGVAALSGAISSGVEGPAAYEVRLVVYDMLGKEVATLVHGHLHPGRYSVEFDATELSTGLYLYKLTSGSFSMVKRLMVVK